MIWLSALIFCWLTLATKGSESKDRLKLFYERINQPDAKYCSDRTRMLPDCKQCIPGLKSSSGSSTCDQYIPVAQAIRDEIGKLTKERFGHNPVPDRPFGLYPCMLVIVQ